MVIVTFNGREERPGSIEEFGFSLDRYDTQPLFELWLVASNGTAMSMLRNNEQAFLMFLRHPGDSGFVSQGVEAGTPVQYTLSNGQVDEYPQSWCIPLEKCYQALAFFFVNDGMQPGWVSWNES